MTTHVQYLPVGLAALACVTVLPVMAVLATPLQEGGPRLVLAGPGADLTQIIEHSGGWVVGMSRAPLTMMAASDVDGFEDRLRENGAWAILDGENLAWLCGVTT